MNELDSATQQASIRNLAFSSEHRNAEAKG